MSVFSTRFSWRSYRWFSLLNGHYNHALTEGWTYDVFVMHFSETQLMPKVRYMNEAKRRTLVSLISQEDFIRENLGVEDYSRKYHKYVFLRWKEHQNAIKKMAYSEKLTEEE